MRSDSHDSAGSSQPPAPETPAEGASGLGAHLEARRVEFKNQVANAREHFEEANEKIKQRTGRDLILAIVTGLGLLILVAGTLLFVPIAFAAIAIVVSGLATWEVARAMQTGGRKVDAWPQVVCAVLIASTGWLSADMWQLWVLLFASVAILAVWRMVAQMSDRDGRTYGDVLGDIAAAAFLPMYVPFLLALALVLVRQEPNGQWWVATMLVIVIAADTGAYAIGVWIGKHPMVPRVSPKKTWEGFAGAATAAIIAGVVMCIFALKLPWWAGLIIGFTILITATLGDLGESLIKRDLGIKDMSSWIPGHGGLLDRLDSILPSTAAALALYYLLAPLGGV